MGSSCIPAFANLVMSHIETTMIFPKKSILPMPIYCRLIDDTLMAIEKQDINQWKQVFLTCNQYLDFTFDSSIENNTVPMLDLEIFIGNKFTSHRKLDFIGYKKPFNNNLYTAPDSYCPDHYKFSWIISENIRLIRNNNNRESYLLQLEEYVNNLHKRGYESNLIAAHLKHTFDDREQLLHPKCKVLKNAIPLLIPHVDGYEHILNAVRMYIDLAQCSFKIPQITPIILRGTNIGDTVNKSNREILNDSIPDMAPI